MVRILKQIEPVCFVEDCSESLKPFYSFVLIVYLFLFVFVIKEITVSNFTKNDKKSFESMV